MNFNKLFLKSLSVIHKKLFPKEQVLQIEREHDPDIISEKIRALLLSDKPAMIARYGATELMCMINYLGVKKGRPNVISYIRNKELDWWWPEKSLLQIERWSGFFPPTVTNVESFCQLMIKDSEEVDVLASWLDNEVYFRNELKNAFFAQGLFLDPFWSKIPWTKALENKKVLVIHPFAASIESQYKKREQLFVNTDVLPSFDLKTIKAVQSLGGVSKFNSWFEALDYMKSEIDKVEFDICLIGAGAYGFPLAAYIKRKGKKAVHMGGSLQLLFGIKGKRWQNPKYGEAELKKEGLYPKLFNEYWVSPNNSERPSTADSVENACYW